MKNPILFTDPNKFAPKTSWSYQDNSIRVEGYQNFNINGMGIYDIGVNHVKEKYDILKPIFKEFKDKSFLDLGCHNGLFSFLANNSGMHPIISFDIDSDNIELLLILKDYIKPKELHIIKENISHCTDKCDIVNALALIHWLYSCTSFYGSVDEIINHLQWLTNEVLFVEWIDPTDGAVQFFKHLGYNKEFVTEDYSKENFLKAIEKYFSSYVMLAKLKNGRELYRCNK